MTRKGEGADFSLEKENGEDAKLVGGDVSADNQPLHRAEGGLLAELQKAVSRRLGSLRSGPQRAPFPLLEAGTAAALSPTSRQ